MKFLYAILVGLSILTACQTVPQLTTTPAVPKFTRDIRPILLHRCAVCHNRKLIPNGWSVENGSLALASYPKQGTIIRPGDPDHSPIMHAITSPQAHHHAMPPLSRQLTAVEVETIRRWIVQGVEWPEGKDGRIIPPRAPEDL